MDCTYESKLTKLKAQDRLARRAALDYWYALGALVLDLRNWRRSPGHKMPSDLAKDLGLPEEELLRAKAFYIRFSDAEIERLAASGLGWECARELALCPDERIRSVYLEKQVASGRKDLAGLTRSINMNWLTEQLRKMHLYRKQTLRVQRRNAGIPLTPRKPRKRTSSAEAVA